MRSSTHLLLTSPVACSNSSAPLVSIGQSIPVRRAVAIGFRRTQETDGSWYGRWGVNYIYGTWQILRGLAAVGENMGPGMDSPRLRLAGKLPKRRWRLG